MKTVLPAILIFVLAPAVVGAEPKTPPSPETTAAFKPVNPIDTHVMAALQKRRITPAPLCTDQVFFRRVYLDVIGTPPEPKDVLRFLTDKTPGKRVVWRGVAGPSPNSTGSEFWE